MVKKTRIFVDGNCIVCDIEVSHYKRIAPNLFEIVDISSPDFDAAKYRLDAAKVQKHLHLEKPDGGLLVGVDAFAHIWSLIPKYQLAAKLIKLPGVYGTAKLGYCLFAEVRPLLPKKNRNWFFKR